MEFDNELFRIAVEKLFSPINLKMDKHLKPNYTDKLEENYFKKAREIVVNSKKKNNKSKKSKEK